jgi:tetratricopeptide (TPR) repeat protein
MLEADAHEAIGESFDAEHEFDYNRLSMHYGAAMDAYRRAAAIGSSDSVVHERICNLLARWTYVDTVVGRYDVARAHFEEGKAAAERAIAIDPKRASIHYQHARIYASYYTQFIQTDDFETGIRKSLSLAEYAAGLLPRDAMAQHWAGGAWKAYADYFYKQGRDVDDAIDNASRYFEKAFQIDPNFTLPVRALGAMNIRRATYAERRGEDPFPYLERSRRHYEQAFAISPDAIFVPMSKWTIEYTIAEAQFRLGIDPTGALDKAERHCRDMLAEMPNEPVRKTRCAYVANIKAEHALATGADPISFMRQQDESLANLGSAEASFYEIRAAALTTSARVALARGQSPVADATQAIEICLDKKEKNVLVIGPAIMTLLQWHIGQKTATSAMFDNYLALFAPSLGEGQRDPLLFDVSAAIHERRAEWLFGQHKAPSDALSKGFALIVESLKRNPHFAPALATRGALFLVEARATTNPNVRESATRRAKESFDEALRLNKFLARETEAAREEVDKMLESQ